MDVTGSGGYIMKRVLGWKIEKEVEWYLFFVLLIGWFFGFIMTSRQFSQETINLAYYIFLFSPMLVALFFLLYDTELLKKVLKNVFSLRALIFSLVGVGIIYLIIILTVLLLTWLGFLIPGPRFQSLGLEDFTFWNCLAFIIKYFFIVLVTAIIPGVFTGLGEEVGWRGFLQHKLSQRHYFSKTVTIVSFFWFIWHLPVILYRSGYDLNAVLFNGLNMFILVVVLTVILGFFFRMTESVLVVALMHVANNVFQDITSTLFLVRQDIVWIKLFTYMLYMAIFAIIILIFFRKELNIVNVFNLKGKS